ncbi:NRBP protein kinase [Capsaspora owczarzaki ATCC 30864]|uniref:non-specific serine/threonine protein kinase n=2 Tax=Capsaspora owczarzaki (strain ATCC 30864) TaxID=595528 RepID=A0A0D2WUI6_CAPO3|nr:NRBP protein kinase [Capsaspora owczarzaki ATCC 30864]
MAGNGTNNNGVPASNSAPLASTPAAAPTTTAATTGATTTTTTTTAAMAAATTMEAQPKQQPATATATATATAATADTSNTAALAAPPAAASTKDADGETSDNDILETSPNGRWQKLRKKVMLKESTGIDEAHLAYDTEEGFEVVWNQITFTTKRLTATDQERLKQKFTDFTQLKHLNLVRFFDFWVDNDQQRLVFITESMTSGTIRAYLRKNKKNNKVVSPKVWKRWCRQILSALRYLHSMVPPIIHGNVRCDSIFLMHNGLAKVGAICLDDIRTHVRTVADASQYEAPELQAMEDAAGKDGYSPKVDVYAFGMCVLEIATEETPYSECANAVELYQKVLRGDKPQAFERLTDPDLIEFISACLAPQEIRPNAEELLYHRFLHEVPMLKVMAAHYILRTNVPYSPKQLPKQLNDFLREVADGAWGTLANINLKESRRALNLLHGIAEPEGEGMIRLGVSIVMPENMTRELVFLYSLQKDKPSSVAREMVGQGLLCRADAKAMERHLHESLVRYHAQEAERQQAPLAPQQPLAQAPTGPL